MKNNAIIIAINDQYSFSFGVLLLSIKKFSPAIFEEADFLCFEDNVSTDNKTILNKICPNIKYINLHEAVKDLPQVILEDPFAKKTRWGAYVFVKLLAFKYSHYYKKVLHLDTDMIVIDDISEIFDHDYLAWRRTQWSGMDNFKSIFNNQKDIVGCSGGCVLFSNRLCEYPINDALLEEAYFKVKSLKYGGLEEKILNYVALKLNIPVNELGIEYNCPLMSKHIDRAKIIHFLDNTKNHKPWQNNIIGNVFPDWMDLCTTWIRMGGMVPEAKCHSNCKDKYRFVRNYPILVNILNLILLHKMRPECVDSDYLEGVVELKFRPSFILDEVVLKVSIVSDTVYDVSLFFSDKKRKFCHQIKKSVIFFLKSYGFIVCLSRKKGRDIIRTRVYNLSEKNLDLYLQFVDTFLFGNFFLMKVLYANFRMCLNPKISDRLAE